MSPIARVADAIARNVFARWFKEAQDAGHLPPLPEAASAPDPEPYVPPRARPATPDELRALGLDVVSAAVGSCVHGVPFGGMCELCDIELMKRGWS